MADALTYFYLWFNSYIDLVFNKFLLFTNVSFGWICIAVMIMGILIRSILNLPRPFPHQAITTSESTSTYYDSHNRLTSTRITTTTSRRVR